MQNIPVNKSEWVKDTSKCNSYKIIIKKVIKNIFLKLMFNSLKKLHELHNDLPFYHNERKMKKSKCMLLILHDKNQYAIHTRNPKQALNRGLILKKIDRVTKFNQKVWLKPYIDMSTKLRQQAKNDFKKDFFKFMNNVVFGKTIGNVRKYKNIKLTTTERRRNCLVSEPNYHTTEFYTEKLLALEIRIT